MVLRPWMYVVIGFGYYALAVIMRHFLPGLLVCIAGTFTCFYLAYSAKKFYQRRKP